MVSIYESISLASITISAILALLIILKFHKLLPVLKVVGIYIIVSAAIDLLSFSLYLQHENNLRFLHLFTLFEFVIISHLFRLLFKSLSSKLNIYYLAVPGTLFILFNTLFIQSINSYNSYSSILVSTIILGYCIHFFILILDVEIQNLQFRALKWFIICLFVFHSISLIVMLFGNVFHDISTEAQSYIWGFRSFVIFATKIILTICFLQIFFSKNNLKTQ